MLSTLKDREPKPLSEVASGGELSRLLLAFYVLFSKQTPKKLFLFDEIDTGVGGLIANTMGEKLFDIATHHQVFCITHLAQIASKANQHLVIAKDKQKLHTTIDYAKKDQEADELKRMLGGDTLLSTLA